MAAKKVKDLPENCFEITEVLGEGSYGNVYKGISIQTGNVVAIKILPIDEDTTDLEKEIEILDQCKNDNIVKYYGCYYDNENSEFWIIMEYCEAGSISDLMGICNLVLKENQIAIILREILIGLKYLHSRNLIHRDIKAGNVLLDKHGNVKITDFGVSVKLASTISKRNTVIGTPFWMAPEVLKESEYNNKADIWSLGITAIELALGNPPHSNLHPMKAIFVIPNKPPPKLPNNFGKKYRDFVKRCCIKDPEKRPSADDMLKHPFIRSAGSKNILKKLFDSCMPKINSFRENYEIDSDKDQTMKRTKGPAAKNIAREESDDNDENYSTDTVVINKPKAKSKETPSKFDISDAGWEENLKFDEMEEDEKEDNYGGYDTVVINKKASLRDMKIEDFDLLTPRPLHEKPGGKSWHRDTFEFYGKVPKRGHKYLVDYYNTLSQSDLEDLRAKLDRRYKEYIHNIKTNYREERNIIDYCIRVKNGEQSVLIRD